MLAERNKPNIILAIPDNDACVEREVRHYLPPTIDYSVLRQIGGVGVNNTKMRSYTSLLPQDLREQFSDVQFDAVCNFNILSELLMKPETLVSLAADIENEYNGAKIIFAVDAIQQWFRQRGISRIGLITTYRDDNHKEAIDFWENKGISIVVSENILVAGGAEGYYDMPESNSIAPLARMMESDIQAALINCYSYPSLPMITTNTLFKKPVVSSNYCLSMAANQIFLSNEMNSEQKLGSEC